MNIFFSWYLIGDTIYTVLVALWVIYLFFSNAVTYSSISPYCIWLWFFVTYSVRNKLLESGDTSFFQFWKFGSFFVWKIDFCIVSFQNSQCLCVNSSFFCVYKPLIYFLLLRVLKLHTADYFILQLPQKFTVNNCWYF